MNSEQQQNKILSPFDNDNNNDLQIQDIKTKKRVKTDQNSTMITQTIDANTITNINNNNESIQNQHVQHEHIVLPEPIDQIQTQTQIKSGSVGVEDFYDNQKIKDRELLDTRELRKFHNWVKAVLIKKYCQKAIVKFPYNQKTQQLSVLDIGCGKGGDLLKWGKQKTVGLYFGMDISLLSLEKAITKCPQSLPCMFRKQDASEGGELFQRQIPQGLYFDIVSSQFAFHYMFENEQRLRNALKNITDKLVQDGFFIITIPDANELVERLRAFGKLNSENQYVFGNKYYSVKFDSKQFPNDQKYYKYGFYLQDAIGSNKEQKLTYVDEFLVEFDNFVRIAKEYGLELVEEENFVDFYNKNKEEYKWLFGIMKITYENVKSMDQEFWHISHLYKVVAFKKIKGLKFNDPIINRKIGEFQNEQLK